MVAARSLLHFAVLCVSLSPPLADHSKTTPGVVKALRGNERTRPGSPKREKFEGVTWIWCRYCQPYGARIFPMAWFHSLCCVRPRWECTRFSRNPSALLTRPTTRCYYDPVVSSNPITTHGPTESSTYFMRVGSLRVVPHTTCDVCFALHTGGRLRTPRTSNTISVWHKKKNIYIYRKNLLYMKSSPEIECIHQFRSYFSLSVSHLIGRSFMPRRVPKSFFLRLGKFSSYISFFFQAKKRVVEI